MDKIDEYIAQYQPPISGILQKVRETIQKAAPDAIEKISWRMPTFYQNENLMHFAVTKKHLGIYPGNEVIEIFAGKLAAYKTTKGSIHLPWDKPIPYQLITEIAQFRVKSAAKKRAS